MCMTHLEPNERILVIAPTLFFFVTVWWGYLFHKFTISEVQQADNRHSRRLSRIITPHFLQVSFTEAIFLSMVNGLIIILQLRFVGFGIILMISGIVVSVTGLILSFMWGYRQGRVYAITIFMFTLIFAVIEFLILFLI
jgi:hypothetical protein